MKKKFFPLFVITFISAIIFYACGESSTSPAAVAITKKCDPSAYASTRDQRLKNLIFHQNAFKGSHPFSKSDKQLLVMYFHIMKIAVNTPKFDEYLCIYTDTTQDLYEIDGKTVLTIDKFMQSLVDASSSSLSFTLAQSSESSNHPTIIQKEFVYENGRHRSFEFSNNGWKGVAGLGIGFKGEFGMHLEFSAARKGNTSNIAGYVASGDATFTYFNPINITMGHNPMTTDFYRVEMPKLLFHEFLHNINYGYGGHANDVNILAYVLHQTLQYYEIVPPIGDYTIKNTWGYDQSVKYEIDIAKPYVNENASGDAQQYTDLLVQRVLADFTRLGLEN